MALLTLIFVVLTLVSSSYAQSNDTLSVYQPEDTYTYHGCYNETTEIPNSNGARALSGGITEVCEDEMTVSLCLELCSEEDEYEYAGLQWARLLPLLSSTSNTVVWRMLTMTGNAGAQTA